MPHTPDDALAIAETFGEIARALAENDDLPTTLQSIVELAVEHLDACEFASITLVEGRNLTSPASSNDLPRVLDHIQAEVGEGPCLDAIKEHGVFHTGDLRSEQRWSKFGPRAYDETGVRSIVALRLFIDGDTMGALNLYATTADVFDPSDVALGAVFAVHAAVALDAARKEESLERKAATRDIIGQAKGILMARQGVSAEEAFDMLSRASQRLNVKVASLAEQLVERRSPRIEDPPVA